MCCYLGCFYWGDYSCFRSSRDAITRKLQLQVASKYTHTKVHIPAATFVYDYNQTELK